MFGLFKRNVPLVGLMDGFMDLHSHLLCGVDDGSSSLDQSMLLLKELSSMGVKAAYCTPHVIADIYPSNTSSFLRAKYDEFKNSISDTYGIEIRLGAEYMLDDTFMSQIDNNPILMGDRYMLIEFTMGASFSTGVYDALFAVQQRGITPIIAHPERYAFMAGENNRILSHMIESGCKMQLNLLSVGGWHGKLAHMLSHKMLDAGAYDFVGSDTHSNSHLNAIKTLAIPRKYAERIELLKTNNQLLFR